MVLVLLDWLSEPRTLLGFLSVTWVTQSQLYNPQSPFSMVITRVPCTTCRQFHWRHPPTGNCYCSCNLREGPGESSVLCVLLSSPPPLCTRKIAKQAGFDGSNYKSQRAFSVHIDCRAQLSFHFSPQQKWCWVGLTIREVLDLVLSPTQCLISDRLSDLVLDFKSFWWSRCLPRLPLCWLLHSSILLSSCWIPAIRAWWIQWLKIESLYYG